MTVYLAGPINGCTDEECNDWRSYAKEHLKCETLDPMRRWLCRGREMEPGIAAEIVHGDEADITASDIVLANHPAPSVDIDMEIRMAKAEKGKIVVTVVPAGSKSSPWLVYHSDVILNSVQDAVSWINVTLALGRPGPDIWLTGTSPVRYL